MKPIMEALTSCLEDVSEAEAKLKQLKADLGELCWLMNQASCEDSQAGGEVHEDIEPVQPA